MNGRGRAVLRIREMVWDLRIDYILSQMEIDFLTPEQLELTLRLSDILSIEDLTVAAAILASFNWNLQSALNDVQLGNFQPNPHVQPNYPTYQNEVEQQYYQDENNYEYEGPTLEEKKRLFQEEHISLVPLSHSLSEPRNQANILQFHKLLAQDSKTHRGKYLQTIMEKSQNLCKGILDANPLTKRRYNENRLKIQNNSKFINTLYTQYKPRWNFTFGTFFLNLTRSYLQGKHLLVYIHSVNPQTEKNYKKILDLLFRQKEISNFVNEHCIVYGIFDNSDEYDILQKYAPLKDLPAFALFKMSKERRQQQFISLYKVSAEKEIFIEWVAQNVGIKLLRRGSKIEVQEQEVKKQKTKEQLENQAGRKKKEEYNAQAYLRAQQDQLYFQLQKTYKQKRQLSLDRKEHIQQQEDSLQKRIEQALKQKQPQNGENVIEIRFRMPNTGETKTRKFYLQDKAEKAFQFVDCFCRQHFQEKFNQFDLIQTHPSLALSQLKEKTLNEIFDGSTRENMIVRQT